ncbi:MAG: GNAT family N-acetyltransferase, partial [Cyanobacteria bacterium J06649_11]
SPESDSPALQWWGTIAANSLIGLLMLWRIGDSKAINPGIWLVPLIVIVLFGIRYLGMSLVARRQGLTVRFRAWESGFPISIAITLAFAGAMYPIPGSVYPTTNQWRYRDLLPKLGWIALAGTLPVLLILWLALVVLQLDVIPAYLRAWLNIMLLVGKPLLLFDIAMPFFPFVSFNGQRLWDWNKIVWAVLTATVVVMFLL